MQVIVIVVYLVCKNCNAFQNKVQDDLVRLQPGFKKELLHSVEVFKTDVSEFGANYDTVSDLTLI